MNMDFKEYKYKSLSISKEHALINSNRKCFPFTYPLKQTSLPSLYEYLILKISALPNIEVVSVGDLFADLSTNKDNRVKVLLRHDIDHDLSTALIMSEIEKKFGLSGCYFLHHTSPYYYGFFDEDLVFNRYESLGDCYLDIQSNGAEVGMHIDPFQVYRLGIDGAEAIVCELEWLRSIGLKISSISAHGSAPYYGAEAFEIFKEWRLSERDTVSSLGAGAMPLGLFAFSEEAHRQFGGSDSLPKKVDLPLGVLSAEELGLKFEANFTSPVDNVDWDKVELYFKKAKTDDTKMHLFYYLHNNTYSRWGQDYTVWLYNMDLWVIASTDSQGTYNAEASTLDVVKFLGSLSGGEKVVLHIHPVYMGYRLHPYSAPFMFSCPMDEYGIKPDMYLKDIEYFNKLWEKRLDYQGCNITIKQLEKEVIHWKGIVESLGKFTRYHINKKFTKIKKFF